MHVAGYGVEGQELKTGVHVVCDYVCDQEVAGEVGVVGPFRDSLVQVHERVEGGGVVSKVKGPVPSQELEVHRLVPSPG